MRKRLLGTVLVRKYYACLQVNLRFMGVLSKLSQFSNGIIGESTLAIPEGAADRFPAAPPDRSERRLVSAANHNAAIGGAGGGAPKPRHQQLRIAHPVTLQCGQVYFGRTPRRRLIAGDRRRRRVRCGPWARQGGCCEVMWSPGLGRSLSLDRPGSTWWRATAPLRVMAGVPVAREGVLDPARR